ncbi:MAG TPA: DUF1015 domain-containing protein, partial [Candidatus Aminicenantes bacterium]|nr:DUF1015 domain-containing protein [Candidatus Aminicenantes bacterium]
MAHIEPFRGIRPKKELAAKVAAPPYDVLDSKEARAMVQGNPFSFLHVGKPEIDLPAGTSLYSPEVYAKGLENFTALRRQGVLFQDPGECFYVYKQVWREHTQVGLVAAASCQDYLDDIIKKHELTREDKENDRMRHIETLQSQTGPVFLTYRRRDAVDRLIGQVLAGAPEYDFATDDGVHHTFYVVSDPAMVDAIQREFAAIDRLYVADGHHRSAAATRIKVKRQQANPAHDGTEEYNFFLSVIFPDNQMKILPYNRVVKDLHGQTPEQFWSRVAEKFTVTGRGQKEPRRPHEFCLYMDKTWFTLEAKPETFDPRDPIASLDASILQTQLL